MPRSSSHTSSKEAESGALLKAADTDTHKGFLPSIGASCCTICARRCEEWLPTSCFCRRWSAATSDYAARQADWPAQPQYQFLAESIWGSVAYGGNAVYARRSRQAILSKYPIVHYRNTIFHRAGWSGAGILHCLIDLPQGQQVQCHLHHLQLARSASPPQFQQLCDLIAAKCRRRLHCSSPGISTTARTAHPSPAA